MIYDDIEGLDDLAAVVRRTTAALRPYVDAFDSIVCTGMSGVTVASPVSIRLKRALVIVRKADDKAHHGCTSVINARNLGKRWVFLDDFISTGQTSRYVETMILDMACTRLHFATGKCSHEPPVGQLSTCVATCEYSPELASKKTPKVVVKDLTRRKWLAAERLRRGW